MSKILHLNSLNLKAFTEQDALDYCSINNIKPLDIDQLNLYLNERLEDISGIRLFKNLEILDLSNNWLEDISAVKTLKKLKKLYLVNNNITDISVLKDLNNLERININDNFIKDISVIKNLKNLQYLNISNLRLKLDQIQYINSCKNLKELYCVNGFENSFFIKEKLNKGLITII